MKMNCTDIVFNKINEHHYFTKICEVKKTFEMEFVMCMCS